MKDSATPIPDLTSPLVRDGEGEHNSVVVEGLGPLTDLVGTWNSPTANPKGYNVMPLPQEESLNSFILKDFPYYEEMSFAAIDGNAPNRGGLIQQNCFVLFYEQRVFFADGNAQNKLVHAENGDWLHLKNISQQPVPYGSNSHIPIPPQAPPPQPTYPIVKQVSVPHGNSILAVGNYQEGVNPSIPNVNTLPTGDVNETYFFPYGQNIPSNLMINPNYALQQAIEGQRFKKTIEFTVSSTNEGGAVTNINFEHRKANVTAFHTTFWLETLEDDSMQLQYSQTMEMTFERNPGVIFYHIDANTLTKVSGD